MHLPAPQRDVRLRHIGAPTRMLSHNPLYPQLSPHLCLPSFVVFNFSLSFLRRLWVSLVSSPQGRPAALQIQSDLRHGMTLASQPWLSSGPGLAAAGQGQSLTLVDHEALHRGRAQLWIGVPNTWPFSRSRLAAAVREYGLPLADHFHHWVSLLFSQSQRLGVWPLSTFVTSHPSRPCLWWTAQRSLLSHVSIFLHHLSRVPWSLTASPGPRIVFSLRAPLLGRLLLGAPLPVPSSLVFLPLNTRWSVLWLVRCSKVPVGGSFSGSRLDSPVSISDSPLVGLRPFLLPMFHPELPFFCWHCGTG